MPEPLITPALRHRSGRAPRLPACSVRRGLVLLLAGLWTGLARAHEFNAGDIVIEHPYALPTLPGVTTGAVYFRSLRNAGHAPERLLGARTDVAASVQLTRGLAPGGAAPRTVLSSIDLPASVTVPAPPVPVPSAVTIVPADVVPPDTVCPTDHVPDDGAEAVNVP